MHGPGDVLGLDPRQIIRTEPTAGTTDFEPNYFAHLELAEAALPWLFTPAAPNRSTDRCARGACSWSSLTRRV